MSEVKTSTLEEQFNTLRDEWIKDVMFHTKDPQFCHRNKFYKQIMELGPDVVPLILKEMKRRRGWWFCALESLTGTNPVPENDYYKSIKKMTTIWLEWGKKEGYVE